MIRYIISIVLFFSTTIFAIILNKVSLASFLWTLSFIIVIVLPFLFVSILYGFRYGFKKMILAFSLPFNRSIDKEKLSKAIVFFKSYEKITWIACIVGILIGVVTLLINFDDISYWGPNYALILLSIFYAAMVNIIMIIPFTILIRKKEENVNQEKKLDDTSKPDKIFIQGNDNIKKSLFRGLIIVIIIVLFGFFINSQIDSGQESNPSASNNNMQPKDTDVIIYYSTINSFDFDELLDNWWNEIFRYRDSGKLAYASFTGVARLQEEPYIRIKVSEEESIFDIHGPWINYTHIYTTQNRQDSFNIFDDNEFQMFLYHRDSVYESNANNAPENASEILRTQYFKQVTILTMIKVSLAAFFWKLSFIIVIVFPFLFFSILYGKKEINSAFSKSYKKITWITCIIALIIGIITLLTYGYYGILMGLDLVSVLLSIFLAAMVNVLIIIPLMILIKKKGKNANLGENK